VALLEAGVPEFLGQAAQRRVHVCAERGGGFGERFPNHVVPCQEGSNAVGGQRSAHAGRVTSGLDRVHGSGSQGK
jgi:hypothetical protein